MSERITEEEIRREKRKMEIGRKRERLKLEKEQINNPRKIKSCRGRDIIYLAHQCI